VCRNIAAYYRELSNIEWYRGRSSVGYRIADIEPHNYSLCRIEFDDRAEI
jgi:hypothetical protein